MSPKRKDQLAFARDGKDGTRGPIEVHMPQLRQSQAPNGDTRPPNLPPIAWNVCILHDMKDFKSENVNSMKPYLTYNDDRPINIFSEIKTDSKTDPSTNPNTDPNREPDREPDKDPSAKSEVWSGPAIVIKTFVESEIDVRPGSEAMNPSCQEPLALSATNVSRRFLFLNSPYLRQALKEMVGYYPSFHGMLHDESAKRTNQVYIEEPFAVLLHHFELIKEAANKPSSEADVSLSPPDLTKEHMQYLLEFLTPIYQASVPTCQALLADPIPKISLDMMWYILKPGTDVYFNHDDDDGVICVGVVSSVQRKRLPRTKGFRSYWEVCLWQLASDGEKITRHSTRHISLDGADICWVLLMRIVPVSLWDEFDKGERREKILRRSRTLLKALQRGYLLVDYIQPTGQNARVVIDHRTGRRAKKCKRLKSVNDFSARFRDYDEMIINTEFPPLVEQDYSDTESTTTTTSSASSSSSGSLSSGIISSRLLVGETNDEYKRTVLDIVNGTAFSSKAPRSGVLQLTDHQLLLLPPETYAYALKWKQWSKVYMDHVQESVPSEQSVANLVIAPDELRTIQALSNRQNSDRKHWGADFIEGKGSGQIILLHGPPGVGKTYTVESIAEWLHRPLISLTIADIGTAETSVEDELMKWFDLAESWNAVLLVDEADIFLERRQNRDLARNGLVTAFLRRMEYFQGLLFLTTNRVGQIDDAFISRIHVAIGYDDFNEETRRKVWNGFFRKLVRERAGKIQIAPDAKKWVLETTGETQLNGRDIRNALQTAITLAEFDNEEDPDHDESLVTIVTKAHFEKVLGMTNRFRSYVTSIRREDERKRAQGRGDRNDYGDAGSANEMQEFLDFD